MRAGTHDRAPRRRPVRNALWRSPRAIGGPTANACSTDSSRLGIDVLPFEAEDAAHAGDIRAELEKAGTPIGHYDYLIAAQARRRGAALVTLNRREFERVPGLIVVDWSA